MARVKIDLHVAVEKKAKAEKILLSKKKRKKNSLVVARVAQLKTVEKYIDEIDRLINAGLLSAEYMAFEHYIALYCWIVEAIVDISVAESVAKSWGKLDLAVRSCCKNKFGGNKQLFLDYIQWLAKDLQKISVWKRNKGIPLTVIPWYKFFCDDNNFLNFKIHQSRIEGFVG